MLDRLENLVLGLDDIAEFQGLAGRKPLEDLDHDAVRGLDAPVQGLAAIGLVDIRRCPEMRRGSAAGCPARRTAAQSYRSRRAPRPASIHDAARRPERTAAASRDRLRSATCCARAGRFRAERRLMSTTMPERSRAGWSGISDVAMVSTWPTDCRMLASSVLWSLRSEASSSRRLVGVLLVADVMEPWSLAVTTCRQGYLTRSSLRLKRYCEHGLP